MGTFQIGQFVIRREVALLVVLVAIGFGVGLGIARLVIGEPRVSPAEYAILVAQVYERERKPDLAVERLKAAGLPSTSDGLASLTQGYATQQNADPRDIQSLNDLARDLSQPTAEPSVAAPGARPIWILSILVFFFVLGMGSLLAVRILGLPIPAFRLPDLGFGRPPITPLRRANGAGPARVGLNGNGYRPAPDDLDSPGDPTPARSTTARQPATISGGSFVGTRPLSPLSSPAAQQPGGATEPISAARVATISSARAQYRFRTSYSFGDEPYDEIHPISDRRPLAVARADPLGACGLSAARHLGGDGLSRYWGFTAWIQDYVSDNYEHKAVGLVSKWAYINFGDEIDEWLRSGQIDELKQVEPSGVIQLETSNLMATLTIQDFEYGSELPTDTYFSRLTAQFEVDLRLPADDETDDS